MTLFDAANQVSRATLFAGDKLGTVLTVVLIVFGGVVTWLIVQDRRLTRLERAQRGSRKN